VSCACRFHPKFFDSVLLGYVLHACQETWLEDCFKAKLEQGMSDNFDAAIAHETKSREGLFKMAKLLGKEKVAEKANKYQQEIIRLSNLKGYRSAIAWLRSFKPAAVFRLKTSPQSLAIMDLIDDVPGVEKNFVVSRLAMWGFFWAYNLTTPVEFLKSPSRKLFNKLWQCKSYAIHVPFCLLYASYGPTVFFVGDYEKGGRLTFAVCDDDGDVDNGIVLLIGIALYCLSLLISSLAGVPEEGQRTDEDNDDNLPLSQLATPNGE